MCDLCERMVDIDYDAEGLWPSMTRQNARLKNGTGLPDYVCFPCAENTNLQTLDKWGYDEDYEELQVDQ